MFMSRHKQKSENQHNLTILDADIRQHYDSLYCVFVIFFTNYVSSEHHGKKLLKTQTAVLRSAGFRFEAWVLIMVLLLLIMILTKMVRICGFQFSHLCSAYKNTHRVASQIKGNKIWKVLSIVHDI